MSARAPGTGDNHLKSLLRSGSGELPGFLRGAVGGYDRDLVGYPKRLKHLLRAAHDAFIGFASHNNCN